MFVSRKKYDALLKQKKDYERIAFETIQLNGRVISNNEKILQEMREVQILNFNIQQRNEELLFRIKELEAKLVLVTEHIQLADDTIFAIEDALYRQKGDNAIQLHIDEYYDLLENRED
jgi:hypothetical protein